MAAQNDVPIPVFEEKSKQERGLDFDYSQKGQRLQHAAVLGATDGLVSVSGDCCMSQIKRNKQNEKQVRPNPVLNAEFFLFTFLVWFCICENDK